MKVLLVAPHPFFQPRGTPIAERALLESLAAAGHRATVLTFPEGEDPGVPGVVVRRIRGLPGTRGVRPGFSLAKVLLDVVLLTTLVRCTGRERFDLLHGVEEGAVMAMLIRLLRGIPYVYDSDSHLAQQTVETRPWLRPLRGLIERIDAAAMRRAIAVLAVCPALADRARSAAPRVPVVVVEDASLLDGEPASADEPLAGDGPLVLYVGNLERYQGVELLVHAFARARERVPDARLAIVGGAPKAAARIRALADRLRIGGVQVCGARPLDRLGCYLTQATVVVSPRLSGVNTPMKVYSYLASGKPLLATRLPTHTQLLDDEVALLATPEPVAFGDALARLLLDPELRERLAANVLRRWQGELGRNAQRRKLVAFYADVARALPSAARGIG